MSCLLYKHVELDHSFHNLFIEAIHLYIGESHIKVVVFYIYLINIIGIVGYIYGIII